MVVQKWPWYATYSIIYIRLVVGKLTASALALNLIGFTTTIRPSPPSHAITLEPFSRAISGLTLTATLSASRSLGLFPPAERREDSNRDNSVLLMSASERQRPTADDIECSDGGLTSLVRKRGQSGAAMVCLSTATSERQRKGATRDNLRSSLVHSDYK